MYNLLLGTQCFIAMAIYFDNNGNIFWVSIWNPLFEKDVGIPSRCIVRWFLWVENKITVIFKISMVNGEKE